MVGFVSQLALPVKGGARSVKPARHLTVAGKALKLKRPRCVVVCAPRALKGALGESRTEAVGRLLAVFYNNYCVWYGRVLIRGGARVFFWFAA